MVEDEADQAYCFRQELRLDIQNYTATSMLEIFAKVIDATSIVE